MTQKLGKHFLFHFNLYIDPKKIRQFLKYYQEVSKWSSNLSVPPKTSSTIASQIIWYNKHILVDKRSLCNTTLADKGINHVGQLFDTDSAMKHILMNLRKINYNQKASLLKQIHAS